MSLTRVLEKVSLTRVPSPIKYNCYLFQPYSFERIECENNITLVLKFGLMC